MHQHLLICDRSFDILVQVFWESPGLEAEYSTWCRICVYNLCMQYNDVARFFWSLDEIMYLVILRGF